MKKFDIQSGSNIAYNNNLYLYYNSVKFQENRFIRLDATEVQTNLYFIFIIYIYMKGFLFKKYSFCVVCVYSSTNHLLKLTYSE